MVLFGFYVLFAIQNVFDATFYVTLPNKAKSHNATTVSNDGLTYTWDLLKTQEIELSFELTPKSNILPIILGSVAVVAVAGVAAYFLIKNKKETTVA